jgi:hypothetical protein
MRIGDVRSGEEYQILRLISQEAADKMRDINSRIRTETRQRGISNALMLRARFQSHQFGRSITNEEWDAVMSAADPYHIKGLVTSSTCVPDRRIIELPAHMKEGIIALVRKHHVMGNGMSNTRMGDDAAALRRSFVRELPVNDRLAAIWTMHQVELAEVNRIHDAIRRERPSWNPGQRVPAHILNPILHGGGSFDVEA